MALRAIWQFMDWDVTHKILYGPKRGWCFAKHPGRSPAKKDRKPSNKQVDCTVSTQTTTLFRATNFFQKSLNCYFINWPKYTAMNPNPPLIGLFFTASCISSFIQCNDCLPIINWKYLLNTFHMHSEKGWLTILFCGWQTGS
jgi:hypothetical protein